MEPGSADTGEISEKYKQTGGGIMTEVVAALIQDKERFLFRTFGI